MSPPKVTKNGSYSATTLPGRTALPFVISTEADPDFLLRIASNDHVCGSPWREPHAINQRHRSRQEIRGSAVERSAVQRSFRGNVFLQEQSEP